MMKTYHDKRQENKGRSVANTISRKSNKEPALQFIDNRPEAVTQRKLQEIADNRTLSKKIAPSSRVVAQLLTAQNPLSGQLGDIDFGDRKRITSGINGYVVFIPDFDDNNPGVYLKASKEGENIGQVRDYEGELRDAGIVTPNTNESNATEWDTFTKGVDKVPNDEKIKKKMEANATKYPFRNLPTEPTYLRMEEVKIGRIGRGDEKDPDTKRAEFLKMIGAEPVNLDLTKKFGVLFFIDEKYENPDRMGQQIGGSWNAHAENLRVGNGEIGTIDNTPGALGAYRAPKDEQEFVLFFKGLAQNNFGLDPDQDEDLKIEIVASAKFAFEEYLKLRVEAEIKAVSDDNFFADLNAQARGLPPPQYLIE